MQETENSQRGYINTVTLVGRTGKDPEIKYFESGSVKASFSLAVNRPVSKENKETDWFNIEVWERKAEIVTEYLKKGHRVAVNGRLNVRKYKDEAGNEREWLSVVANDFSFLESKRDTENSSSDSPNYNSGYNSEGQNAPF